MCVNVPRIQTWCPHCTTKLCQRGKVELGGHTRFKVAHGGIEAVEEKMWDGVWVGFE